MVRKNLVSIFTFVIAASFVLNGCASKSTNTDKAVSVWAIGDCYKVNPANGKVFNPFVKGDYKAKNFIWDAAQSTVYLSGAKNEYVSFQVIVDAKDYLNGVDVLSSEFKGPSVISNENVKLFKEHYLKVKKTSSWPLPSTGLGEYPDALIPLDRAYKDIPFSVRDKRNQAIWVDVYIPKDVKAGEYQAVFSVIGEEFNPRSITVKLTVWDFMLPDAAHLRAWTNYFDLDVGYGVNRNSEEYLEVERNVMRLCHDHRMEALHRHAKLYPRLEDDIGDLIYVNWEPYDQRIGAFLDGTLFDNRTPPNMYLLPVNTWPDQRWPKMPFHMQQTLTATIKHFHAKGWDLNKGYVYLWDEPEKEDLAELMKWAKFIKSNAPQLKTTVAFLRNFDAQTVKEFSSYVDLWMVDAGKVDLKLFKELKSMGKEVGFYQQGEPWCGNENLDTDGLGFRTWPWIAAKYDIETIYLYVMTNWWRVYKKGGIWENPQNESWSNSQGVLIYPGKYLNTLEAIGSVRLKQLRRGMQDYEYIYLAKKMGKDPQPIVNSIVKRALSETQRSGGSHGEWSRDPEDWFKARKKLASLILGTVDREKIRATIPQQNIFKRKIKNLFKRITAKKPKGKVLFTEDFEEGSAEAWQGGQLQEEITYQGSKYALEAVPGGGDYTFVETWKKLRVGKDTYLSFAYYCESANELIINFWSSERRKNLSATIRSPKQGQWITVKKNLNEFDEDIGRHIKSIHFATPNREGARFFIDNVRLFNE
ncbi:glycoside hydrolase domain-containing protein [Candidatus Omnitrophota bacterium]